MKNVTDGGDIAETRLLYIGVFVSGLRSPDSNRSIFFELNFLLKPTKLKKICIKRGKIFEKKRERKRKMTLKICIYVAQNFHRNIQLLFDNSNNIDKTKNHMQNLKLKNFIICT